MSTLEMHNSFDDDEMVVYNQAPPYNSSRAAPQNKSGLHPQGHAVLVRPYEPELGSGIIAIPENVRASMQLLEQRAVVVELGQEAWFDELHVRAMPGEHVLIAKYAGVGAVGVKDGVQYRIVNDRDIYCTLEVEENG